MSVPQAASASPMPPGVTDPNYEPPPGRLGNLSVTQQLTLDKFRKELQDEGHFVEERHDDATLLRFLRARKFDLALAKTMFLNAEQWRKDFGVDEIVTSFKYPEQAEVDKYYPQFYHKIDKDGRPIYIEILGKFNYDSLYSVTTPERQLQRLVQQYEKLLRQRFPICSKVVGHPVETCTTILDLGGVGLGSFYRVKDFISQASSIGQDRYPETMGKFYIINAPWAFSAVWAVCKRWLDEVTVSKINILGSDYQTSLLQQIPAENLPKQFGGSCSCIEGCSLSDAGPWKEADP